jgi:hypothetical protein
VSIYCPQFKSNAGRILCLEVGDKGKGTFRWNAPFSSSFRFGLGRDYARGGSRDSNYIDSLLNSYAVLANAGLGGCRARLSQFAMQTAECPLSAIENDGSRSLLCKQLPPNVKDFQVSRFLTKALSCHRM